MSVQNDIGTVSLLESKTQKTKHSGHAIAFHKDRNILAYLENWTGSLDKMKCHMMGTAQILWCHHLIQVTKPREPLNLLFRQN